MSKVLQCPHKINISGLYWGCLNGKFPADCDNCDCPDKYYVESYVTTASTEFSDGEMIIGPAIDSTWKSADGPNLPEYDREVIALLSDQKVVYAHRPNPNGYDGKSLSTDKIEHYTPITYGKGGWNQSDVVWWLDLDIPK